MQTRVEHKTVSTKSKNQPALPELPPEARLVQVVMGSILSQAVYAAANLGVADHLRAGPKSATELARLTQSEPDALYRLLRTLASVEIFEEDDERRFSLTPMASCLCEDQPGSLRNMVMMMGSSFRLRAWEQITHSIKTGKSAFEAVFGKGPFEYFREHEEAAGVFHRAMVSYTSSLAPAVAAAYPFGDYAKVVDVAGGHGYLLASILRANPRLQGILFDLPEVVRGAGPLLAEAGVADRCEVVGGNFFESVVRGGDVYIMKQIIHDWDDEKALAVLLSVRRAMTPGTKLLLVETVIPSGREPAHAKLLDLEVLVALGGKERTEQEYRNLYAVAGLKLTRVLPTAAGIQIVEGVAV